MRLFTNDYAEGAAPEVLDALVRTNLEQHPGYTEGDEPCARAAQLVREACGRDDVAVEFAIGGTSANLVGVTGLLRDWEGVICAADAHINVHETGAIAAAGRTVLATHDADAFLTPEEAERVWRFQTSTGRHMTRPAAIYISDTNEFGGVWSLERFDAICDWAQSHDLAIFVDGARLASALTAPGADLTLPHIAARADAFTMGGTKNGALFGEAVVIANERLREAWPFLIKERGGLLAKGRLLGVQFEALLTPGPDGESPWFRYARHANEQAGRVRAGLVELGFEPFGDSNSNQQFFCCTREQAAAFGEACGCNSFLVLPDGREVVRFVCSWATEAAHVDELLEFARTIA